MNEVISKGENAAEIAASVNTPLTTGLYGVDETIEVIEFGFEFSDAIQRSLKDDGKITFKDSLNFASALFSYGPRAISGIQMVPKELSELSEEDREEILSYFEGRFDLTNDQLEAAVEKSLRVVLELVNLVKDFKSL